MTPVAPAGRAVAPPHVYRPVLTAVVTSTLTAVVGVFLVTMLGPGPLRTDHTIVEREARLVPMSTSNGAPDVAGVTEALRASVAQLEVIGSEGVTHGSGVIIRSDGTMLTSHRLVAGARVLRVMLHDGRRVGSRLVGSDEETDIAVFDLEGDGFESAAVGSSTVLKVGQPVITMGTPAMANNGPVVSVGVINALGQTVAAGATRLLDMIQTAAIAPGCTGGAVVDASGSLVGIAVRNIATDAGMVGYATPIDVAELITRQLLADGKVRRVWLGIEGEDMPAAAARNAEVAGGAVVRVVNTGSPAERSGIVPTDMIVALDGRPVTSMAALQVAVRRLEPNDRIQLDVVRDGRRVSVRTTVVARPDTSG